MKAPVRWLHELVDYSDPEEAVAERLSLAGLEVESMDRQPDGEIVLEIAILPNIARCMSMVGVAREVAAVTGGTLRPDLELGTLPAPDAEHAPAITDPALCQRFAVLAVAGTGNQDAPEWIRDRLRAAGLNSVSGLVDLGNYIMLELGQPLHVYDLDTLGGRRLGVRAGREGESLRLLTQADGAAPVPVPAGVPVIVDDRDRPVGLAGLMGGHGTAVGPDTTSILVEAASFDFLAIRRAQTALGMVTDASARFSRGADPALVPAALGRFLALLEQVSPGFRVLGHGEAVLTAPARRTIRLGLDELTATIGARYTAPQVRQVFDRLGLDATQDGEVFTVTVGSERADLESSHDLMEEVVRILGLDHVPATMPVGVLPPPTRDPERAGHTEIRKSLLDAGFTEAVNYTLSSPEAHAALGADGPLLGLINPPSSELRVMRRSLLPGLLGTLERNLRYVTSAQLFEHGVVVLPEETGTEPGLPKERKHVAVVLAGEVEQDGLWSDATRAADLYDITDAILGLARHLHIDDARVVPAQALPYTPGACAELVCGTEVLGRLGLLRDDVAARFGLTGWQVFAAECRADLLVARRQVGFPVRTPSRFPSARLDLSVAVPDKVVVGDLLRESRAAGGGELSDVSVFDIFTGEGVGSGRKAVGLRLMINPADRTLTTREAEDVRGRVMAHLAAQFGAVQR